MSEVEDNNIEASIDEQVLIIESMGLGFQRESIIDALEKAGSDTRRAVSFLIHKRMDPNGVETEDSASEDLLLRIQDDLGKAPMESAKIPEEGRRASLAMVDFGASKGENSDLQESLERTSSGPSLPEQHAPEIVEPTLAEDFSDDPQSVPVAAEHVQISTAAHDGYGVGFDFSKSVEIAPDLTDANCDEPEKSNSEQDSQERSRISEKAKEPAEKQPIVVVTKPEKDDDEENSDKCPISPEMLHPTIVSDANEETSEFDPSDLGHPSFSVQETAPSMHANVPSLPSQAIDDELSDELVSALKSPSVAPPDDVFFLKIELSLDADGDFNQSDVQVFCQFEECELDQVGHSEYEIVGVRNLSDITKIKVSNSIANFAGTRIYIIRNYDIVVTEVCEEEKKVYEFLYGQPASQGVFTALQNIDLEIFSQSFQERGYTNEKDWNNLTDDELLEMGFNIQNIKIFRQHTTKMSEKTPSPNKRKSSVFRKQRDRMKLRSAETVNNFMELVMATKIRKMRRIPAVCILQSYHGRFLSNAEHPTLLTAISENKSLRHAFAFRPVDAEKSIYNIVHIATEKHAAIILPKEQHIKRMPVDDINRIKFSRVGDGWTCDLVPFSIEEKYDIQAGLRLVSINCLPMSKQDLHSILSNFPEGDDLDVIFESYGRTYEVVLKRELKDTELVVEQDSLYIVDFKQDDVFRRSQIYSIQGHNIEHLNGKDAKHFLQSQIFPCKCGLRINEGIELRDLGDMEASDAESFMFHVSLQSDTIQIASHDQSQFARITDGNLVDFTPDPDSISTRFKVYSARETIELSDHVDSTCPKEDLFKNILINREPTEFHKHYDYEDLVLRMDVDPARQHLPLDMWRNLILIFRRMDEKRNGVLLFADLITEVFELLGDQFDISTKQALQNHGLTLGDDGCVHIEDFLTSIDTLWFQKKIEETELLSRQLSGKSNLKSECGDESGNEEDEKAAEAVEDKVPDVIPFETRSRKLCNSILTDNPDWQVFKDRQSTRTGRWRQYFMDIKTRMKRRSHSSDKVPLWRNSLVEIQSKFGGSFFVYFQFSRWLFLMNFVSLLLMLSILVPEISSFFLDHGNISFSEYVTIAFGSDPDSWYYYSSYAKTYWNGSYRMDIIWCCVVGGLYVLAFLCLLQALIHTSTNDQKRCSDYAFCDLTFAEFDFSRINNAARQLNRNRIIIDLHERLLEEIEQEKFTLTYMTVFKRVVGGLATIIIAAANCACIYLLVGNTDYIRDKAYEAGGFYASASEYIVPAGVSILSAIMPFLVVEITDFESWTSQSKFVMTFIRVFLLRLTSVMATLWMAFDNNEIVESDCPIDAMGRVLIQLINFDTASEFLWCVIIPPCLMLYLKWSDKDSQTKSRSELISDTFPSSDNSMSSAFDPQFIGEKLKSAFDIEANVVDLMYRQTIIWTALPFSPMSTAIASLSLMALGVDKQFRWFYGMLILSWCVALSGFFYFTTTESQCSSGPYVNGEIPQDILDAYYESAPPIVTTLVSWAQTLVWFVIFVLGLWGMYIYNRKKVYQRDAKQYKEMLQTEKDEKLAIIRDYRVNV